MKKLSVTHKQATKGLTKKVKLLIKKMCILLDYSNLEIPGYNLVRFDHSSNKRGGVCIYCQCYLSFVIIRINYPNECGYQNEV